MANLAAIERFAAKQPASAPRWSPSPEYSTYEKKKVDAMFPAVAESLD